MFGEDYPKKYISKRSGEYDKTLADYSFAQDVLKWKPTKKIRDYIKTVISQIFIYEMINKNVSSHWEKVLYSNILES